MKSTQLMTLYFIRLSTLQESKTNGPINEILILAQTKQQNLKQNLNYTVIKPNRGYKTAPRKEARNVT